VVNSRFQQGSKKLTDCTVIARLLARFDVLVGWLADLWYRTCYGWGRQLLGCRHPCGCTASTRYRRRVTVLAATYKHHCWYVGLLTKAVQRGDPSNIRHSQGRIFDRSTCNYWAPLSADKIW